MATILLQPPPETISVQEQSLRSIQTCLRASISAILHRRGCLPTRAFGTQDYMMSSDRPLAAGMQILKRGESYRADCLLDWLDGPAFDALRAGTLRGLQLCIHPSSTQRHRVLETYSFGVWYDDAVTSTANARVDIGDELYSMIYSLDKYFDDLPALPDTRYLSMNLFLRETYDPVQPMADFETLRKEYLLFPKTEHWPTQSDSFHHIASARHRTALRVSYTGCRPGVADHLQAHPSVDDYSRLVAVNADLAHLASHDPPPRPSRQYQVHAPGIQDTEMADIETETEVNTPSIVSRQETTENDILSVRTQRIKRALQSMVQPEQLTQGDTQAALSLTPSAPVHAPTLRDQYARELPRLVRVTYRREKLRIMQEGEAKTRQQALALAKEIGGTTESGQTILCICGFSKPEGDLLHCACCQTWQHSHCHGFVGGQDPRIPPRHFCYVCTIDPQEVEQSANLIRLALPRRAMYRILRKGVKSKTDFATGLHAPPETAYPLLEQFKTEELIVAAHGAHKAGHKASGKPSFVPGGFEAYQRTLDMYFDPTSHLEEYVEPCAVKPSVLANILRFHDIDEFPQGVTPMSERRRKKEEAPPTRRRKRKGVDRDEEATGKGPIPVSMRSSAPRVTPINLNSPSYDQQIILESTRLIDAAPDTSPLSRKADM